MYNNASGYSRLESNIINVIKEAQIKIGYDGMGIKLYYPLGSLCSLTGRKLDMHDMNAALCEFAEMVKEKLGPIVISEETDSRFCLDIPAKGTQYVHDRIDESEFLVEFINAVRSHKCDIDGIIALFRRYSDKVHAERVTNGEFDYLVYFEDGVPDEFIYCLTDEGCGHVAYHRFTKEDYLDFGF